MEADMLRWLLVLLGLDSGPCIDPLGACHNAGPRIDPEG